MLQIINDQMVENKNSYLKHGNRKRSLNYLLQSINQSMNDYHQQKQEQTETKQKKTGNGIISCCSFVFS